MNIITQWDLSILDALQACRTPCLDRFFSDVTHLGDHGIFWIVFALVLLCIPRTRRLGVCVAAALLLDLLLCNVVLKPLIARPRPYVLRDIALLITPPGDFSFPSGHAAAASAATSALALRRSRLALPVLALALIIAFSRLYLYVHYPTDVFGGILLGCLCGLTSWLICRKFLPKKES
ncbi:MAG: phosphatase PAP2 family protein [Oscillospiraceae bacterium]|nr:phosphatase PAP2 family protein [Oscillospiraceae bacterium]